VARSNPTALPNENSVWASDVLVAIKALRHAYRQVSDVDMDRCSRELLALVRNHDARVALDRELATRNVRPSVLGDKALIEQEARLGDTFGYSHREVLRYVQRARGVVDAGMTTPNIATSAQLVEYLERLHAAVAEVMAEELGWLARRRKTRAACRTAQERLFSVGAIIANASFRNLFDFSYTIAVGTLAQELLS
jgi:hypothetical protein